MKSLLYTRLQKALKSYPPRKSLHAALQAGQSDIEVSGAKGSFLAFLLAEYLKSHQRPALVVVPNDAEAEHAVEDLRLFGLEAELFPWWGTMPYRPSPESSPAFGRRVHLLARMLRAETFVAVVPVRALIGRLPAPDELERDLLTVQMRGEFDPAKLSERLARMGYMRVPRVTVRGEYALRGEVLDIYEPGTEEPYRVVFSFDEVEAIRTFDPDTQSSTGKAEQITIHPMREVVWDEERIGRLREALTGLPEFGEHADGLVEELQARGSSDGEEYLYPLAFPQSAGIYNYLASNGLVVLAGLERLPGAIEALEKEYRDSFLNSDRRGLIPRPERILQPAEEALRPAHQTLRTHALTVARTAAAESAPASAPAGRPAAGAAPAPSSASSTAGAAGDANAIRFSYDPPRSFFGNIEFFKQEMRYLEGAGYEVYVLAESESQAARVSHMLHETGVTVLPDVISEGFTIPDCKISVVQENEVFGRRKRVAHSVRKTQSSPIESFVDLNVGDLVVHVNYGIGRYNGIKRIAAAGTERDYIQLEYAGEEYVYIPIEQVNLIQRYIGTGGAPPRLDTLGGRSWQTRKNKVRKNVEDLADRLVQLYSRRKTALGFQFPPDSEWQYDFEAAFPYEETADQLRCIEEVKTDMESPQPMDRLVCGDVGYGKTEIAMRAAFKAVAAGKQVALLAPTTILVEQHYENLLERLERFPVETSMLSRFVGRADQKKVLAKLASGEVDIVIGTHRLLQKDVQFKDLGLVIVDEEQRFGVKDKERLKELKATIDCLTLTATPIPRTLHMSLLRIRDLSLLETPPHNRLPIETVIKEFSEEEVAAAIRREVERGGQVFYLHNRVETLPHVKQFLERLLPELMIETAHGQLPAKDLEEIMHRFVHGASQVLVSTTIIENGIDIPNVNTMIIDRADMYGIAQLYQLRGRVGRSDRPAYAYLFYPDQRALSEIAMKRLQIISDYTELGSGFKIALKDLEVRGAGNLLGRQQSGDILSVGFDMYLQLLDEAIRRRSDDGEEVAPEVFLDLNYSGYIPDDYISEPMEKMAIYKKIAAIRNEQELEQVVAELEDRFGPLPDELHSLLSLAEIRSICTKLHISSIVERKGVLEITFAKVAKLSVDRVMQMIDAGGGSVRLHPEKPHSLLLETGAIGLQEKSEFIRGRLSSLI